MEWSREIISISSLEMSKQRLDYSLTVMLKRRVPMTDRKLKVTSGIFFIFKFL